MNNEWARKKDWPGTTNNLETIIPLTVHRKRAKNRFWLDFYVSCLVTIILL